MIGSPKAGRRGALLALACALALAACSDPAERAAEHLQRAEAFFEDERYDEAMLEYRSVLQIDPNRADAHYGLARVYLAQRKPQKAFWELQETARLAPDNLEARLQFAQFLLLGGDEELETAIGEAEAILQADDARAAAWLVKGRALEGLERYDEAQAAYETAVERAPEEGGPLLVLANFHRGRDEPARAEALYRRLAEVEPGFTAQAALAAFLASRPGREDEAEAVYRKALAQAEPDKLASAHTLLANFLWSEGRREDAIGVLREGVDAVPEARLDLLYLLARFYHADGRTDEADAIMEEATRARPDDAAPWLVLSSYRGQLGDLEGALEAAEKAAEAEPDDPQPKLRRAELLVDMGYRAKDSDRIAEGAAIVEAVLAREPSMPEAQFVRAKIHLAEGELEEAEAALRSATEARADWAQAHMLLGSTLFLQRDALGARSELVRALELDANLKEAQRVLVQVYAALGDNDLSAEMARRLLETSDDPKLRVQLAQALVRQEHFDEALEVLEDVPEADRTAEAWYAEGRIHAIRGRPEAARGALEKAAALEPGRYEVLRALLQLDVREGRAAQSLERVQAALRESPDDARLTRLHGEAALFVGDGATAEASFQRALELDPNDIRSVESLARYLLVAGRQDEVLSTYQKAIERNPDSATLRLMLASLHEVRGEKPQAIEAYEAAIRLDPDLAVAKNNLAYLLADGGRDLDRALDLAQAAKERLPDSPSASDTLGWVLYKKNEPGAAIFHLRDAVKRMRVDDPQRGVVQHHLALAYEANGEPDEALRVVQEALDELERRQEGASGEAAVEPAWAGDLRGMAQRLAGG